VRDRGGSPGVTRVGGELVAGEPEHGQYQQGQRGGPPDPAVLALAAGQGWLEGRRRPGRLGRAGSLARWCMARWRLSRADGRVLFVSQRCLR